MLRKDLKPGDMFEYDDYKDNKKHEKVEAQWRGWVPYPGQTPPPGFHKSFDPPLLSDGDRLVVVLNNTAPASAEPDAIDPAHYKSLTPEPIDVTEGWELNPNLASVIWYIARAGRKKHTGDAKADAKQDLEKARRFLSREIARLDGRRAWD